MPQLPAASGPAGDAQLGDLVVDCAGVYATVLTVTDYELAAELRVHHSRRHHRRRRSGLRQRVQRRRVHQLAGQDVVSAQMDPDAEVLWEWAEKQRADGSHRRHPRRSRS